MRIRDVVTGLFVVSLLAGCSKTTPESPAASVAPPVNVGADQPLIGTHWVAQSVRGIKVDIPKPPTAVFGTNEIVTGTNGCNQYHGPFQDTGGGLLLGPLASTMMACEPDIEVVSQGFDSIMDGHATYSLTGSSLTIINTEGTIVFHAK